MGDSSGEARNSGSEEQRLGVPKLLIGLDENWKQTKAPLAICASLTGGLKCVKISQIDCVCSHDWTNSQIECTCSTYYLKWLRCQSTRKLVTKVQHH